MRTSRLLSLPSSAISLDTETHLSQPGLGAPPIVCASIAGLNAGKIEGSILTREQALEIFQQLIADPTRVIVFARAPYDLLVIAVALARLGVDVMPQIYAALADDRIYDILIGEPLNAVAGGHLGRNPATGGPLLNRETGRAARYSLDNVTEMLLGRADAKKNDVWRMRYFELEDVPMERWPQPAIDYPIDDARNTFEDALAQTGHLPRLVSGHRFAPVPGDALGATACLDCGATRLGHSCMARRPMRNLHDLSNQVWTDFAMHVGGTRGFHVDQASVDIIERYALRNKDRGIKPFVAAGLIREEGTENRSELKRRVALAYGATGMCETCGGSGKVPSPAAKPVRCDACRGRSVDGWKQAGALMRSTGPCSRCASTGLMPNPNPPMIVCFAWGDLDEDGNPTKLKTCDGTGLLIDEVPRSEKEGIAYGADVLHESGDEFLMAYGDYQEDAKDLNVYIPYLRRARVQAVDGGWRDVPLTLQPNVIVETGRTSYSGVIQLFKRAPGHHDLETKEFIPSLRECITARPGYYFSSEDYKAGELYTHAQSCIWIVGHSDLATALLGDLDPHSALAATVLGVTYDEFIRRKKETKFKNARQAAKPFTFGKPGGMGSPKLVLQQRKQGPDTPCAGGPSQIDDGLGKGGKIEGYKGTRFCILMNDAKSCGAVKVTKWGRPGHERTIRPTCLECLRCADHLGAAWVKQWSENKPYFAFVSDCVDNGMVITADALARWPHLREVYRSGQCLAPGEIMQHVSGRIRNVATAQTESPFCSAANGFFQGLLGDVAKAALRRVSRECYDRTVRVPSMAHANSRPSAYAGGTSPLYGSHMIGFFHDELFMEHPIPMAHDGAMRTSEIMTEELRHYCPDVAATAAAEPTLMLRWLKNAAPRWRDGGEKQKGPDDRLVPWESV